LSEADSLAPGHPLVLNNLATAWWAKGDTARAAALYLRALDSPTGSPYAATNLARLRRGLPAP
jgi:Flp pilus assembly protein TadD